MLYNIIRHVRYIFDNQYRNFLDIVIKDFLLKYIR